MSCKYCDIKMRPLDEDMGVLKGESWKDKFGEGGYIGQSYNDKFHIVVYYDAGCACTDVPDVKFCPFCGEELKMPAEPLIKDEKIRKAVRAWAEVNGIGECVCKEEIHCITFETERGMFISFENADPIPPEGKYTIPELCGEEEK